MSELETKWSDTGTVGNPLTEGAWFDPVSNPVKRTHAGNMAFTKSVYDSLNRPTASYIGINAAGSSDDNDVSNDTVIFQNETTYDDGGNAIQTTVFRTINKNSLTVEKVRSWMVAKLEADR